MGAAKLRLCKKSTDEMMRVHYGYTKGLELGEEKGRVEGKQEGLKEGQANFLIALLIERFGALSLSDKEHIEQGSLEQLLVWGKKVLNAETTAQVFE